MLLSPIEKTVALLLNKLKSSLFKSALCLAWLNWPRGSWEEDGNEKETLTN